jgi:diguanylate cyclase (GGDEF)-like protein
MSITGAEHENDYRTLVALTRINHSIGAFLDLEGIARILVREIKGTVSYDGCAILLIERSGIKVLSSLGFSRIFRDGHLTLEAPLIRYILTTKKGIVTGDVPASEFVGCVPPGEPIKSLICEPIIIEGDVRGIIHLYSALQNAFKEEDVDFVRLLAKEVSVAFERSFLFSQIKGISFKDGLTACYNRRKFDIDIAAAVAETKKSGRPLSLLMADIDWFKKYNDFHGHQKGDSVLKKLVQILKMGTRPYDGVYRYGGEEFTLILADIDKNRAAIVAERLRKTVLKDKFEGAELSQPGGKLTISIGVAGYPVDATKVAELVNASDKALYLAKKEGRNRVRIFDKEKGAINPFLF